ncbi:unnamed protein product, partial [Amoebophrya sp. A25]|eukprot:GSA25T00005741001.1
MLAAAVGAGASPTNRVSTHSNAGTKVNETRKCQQNKSGDEPPPKLKIFACSRNMSTAVQSRRNSRP